MFERSTVLKNLMLFIAQIKSSWPTFRLFDALEFNIVSGLKVATILVAMATRNFSWRLKKNRQAPMATKAKTVSFGRWTSRQTKITVLTLLSNHTVFTSEHFTSSFDDLWRSDVVTWRHKQANYTLSMRTLIPLLPFSWRAARNEKKSSLPPERSTAMIFFDDRRYVWVDLDLGRVPVMLQVI